MLGTIGFEDLLVSCIIGLLPEERLVEQDLFITLNIEVDFAKIANNDDLANAVDYVELAEKCKQIAKKSQFNMIESLAVAILKDLEKNPLISWIEVIVKKPGAIKEASTTIARLEKGRRKENGWLGH